VELEDASTYAYNSGTHRLDLGEGRVHTALFHFRK